MTTTYADGSYTTIRTTPEGRWLRALRVERGLSIRQLAERASIGAGTLSDLERGRHRPSKATMARLAEALGTTPGPTEPAPSAPRCVSQTYSIPTTLRREVAARGEAEGVPASTVVQRALRAYLADGVE